MTARLPVKVVPGASQSKITGWLGEELKIRVGASPEKGKANKQVKALLAKILGLYYGQVEIIAGLSSPHKLIEFSGLDVSALLNAFGKPDDT